MKEGLTKQERVAVVKEAIRLVKHPETFIQGQWKCPLYVQPGVEDVLIPEIDSYRALHRGLVRALDESDRPIYSYCVEGAVNQAGINILGVERATYFGATHGAVEHGELEPSHNSDFVEYLSVNDVARIMFADFLRERMGGFLAEDELENVTDVARQVNDDSGPKDIAHKNVMKMLKERVRTLKAG